MKKTKAELTEKRVAELDRAHRKEYPILHLAMGIDLEKIRSANDLKKPYEPPAIKKESEVP